MAIAQYSDVHGLDEETRSDLLYVIPRMDQAYLKWCSEKTKKDIEAAKKTPPTQTQKVKRR